VEEEVEQFLEEENVPDFEISNLKYRIQ